MQGYETIWKEKLKFLWYATAVFNGCCESLDFIGFLGWKYKIYTLFTPLEDRIGRNSKDVGQILRLFVILSR